jgi:hypothetical protein
LLPKVIGIATTKQEETEAENARMKAAVAALEGLTAGQLKMLIEKAGAELKKLGEKTKKKSIEDKVAAKNV